MTEKGINSKVLLFILVHEYTDIVLYRIVLKGWSLPPNALRYFKINCVPPYLGIRTWICRLNFAQRPFFLAWGSLTSLKSQTQAPSIKSLPEDLILGIFTSCKNPSTSVGFEPANLGSRGEHVSPRPPRLTNSSSSPSPSPSSSLLALSLFVRFSYLYNCLPFNLSVPSVSNLLLSFFLYPFLRPVTTSSWAFPSFLVL